MEVEGTEASNDTSENAGPHMALRVRPRKRERSVNLLTGEFHFLDDFDPEKSNREKRKMSRKLAQTRSAYNEYGHIRHSDMDICDCMDVNCPGCWFECENCGSTKCGLQCRVNRKFFFEAISYDGKDGTFLNPHANIERANK